MITGVSSSCSLTSAQLRRLAKLARDVKAQTGHAFSLRDPELLTKLLKAVRRSGKLETLQELVTLQQEIHSKESTNNKSSTIIVENYRRHGVKVKYYDMQEED